MDEELTLTRAQLAQRIGFSESVIRKWENLFSEFVTSPPGVKGLAQARRYNAEDVVLFATVAQLRAEGVPLEKIRQQLPDRLEQARAALDEGQASVKDYLPPDTEQRQVAFPLYLDALRQLEATEGELTATAAERDYLRAQLEELRATLIDAERRAAAAEAQRDMLAARPPGDEREGQPDKLTFWQRFFGRRPE